MTKQFVDAVRKSQVAMRPIVPLATPLDLGYVGTVSEDGVWTQVGTLASILGLNSLGGELPVQDKNVDIKVTSGRSVSVGLRGDAKTNGVLSQFANLKGKASVSFDSENGFFLVLRDMTIRQLAEPAALHPAIITAFALGRWKEEWVLVHQIGIAKKLTMILASESDTTVVLAGSGKAALQATAEVDLSAGFKFVASNKAVEQVTGGKNVSAFYGAYKVKSTVFTGARVERFKLANHPFGLELDQYPADARLSLDEKKMFRRL